jgi:hypothetical protein
MMRIATRLKCDNCGKIKEGDEYHYGLPKGWYIVGYHCQRYAAYDDWRALKHFCSWECMIQKIKADGKELKAELQLSKRRLND